jgi:hypothetical protein
MTYFSQKIGITEIVENQYLSFLTLKLFDLFMGLFRERRSHLFKKSKACDNLPAMNQTCATNGKVRFPTRLHAEVRILSVEKESGVPFYSYECPYCCGWHMTKSPNFQAILEHNLRAVKNEFKSH